MADELAPVSVLPSPLANPRRAADPVALLLADKRSAETRRAYAADLARFFGGSPTPDAVRQFLTLPVHEIALRLATYKADMIAAGLTEGTINRRLAAVRSLLKMAHRLGLAATDGRGLVAGEKVQRYRDTRGVDAEALRRLLAAPGTDTVRGLRDTAILRLMAEVALRRAEVCALNVGDFDAEARRVLVLGKGKGTQRAPMTISEKCAGALGAYLAASGHGDDPAAPLFQNLDHRPDKAGGRLHANGLRYIVVTHARAVGLDRFSPHKIRHSAITLALDATGGDVRRVQRLSRHADVRTLLIYDDNRADMQGEVTGILSDLL